ncbi:MAG: glycosyltransferase family 39 protein [Acidimicrobiales bacterium]
MRDRRSPTARFAVRGQRRSCTRRPNRVHPPRRWRNLGFAILASCLVAGLVLRIVAPSPLWLDEALSVHIARLGFGDMVEALRHDGHPSLYYLLLGWWIDLFGSSDVAVRSLSGVASLATVPVLWALGRRRSPTIGVVAAALGLTSPYLLRYGTEARMYALLALLVALTWLGAERALERPSAGRLLLVTLGTAALVHTHYWSFWLVGAAFLGLVLARHPADPDRRLAGYRVAGAVAVGGATFAVWLPVFLDQLASTGTPWASRARPAEIAVETMEALGGNNRFEGQLLGMIVVVLALLGVFGRRRGRAIELTASTGPLTATAVVTAGTITIGAAVALATGSAFEGRYAAVVVPFVLVAAARGIALFAPRSGLVVLAALVAFSVAVGIDEARRDRTQGGEVATALAAGVRPGDVVAFCPDQVGPATLEALDRQVTTFAFPRGDGQLVDWRDYTDAVAATTAADFVDTITDAAGNHDVWLVAGLGYHGLANRCEEIIGRLDATRRPVRLVAPRPVFEPMMLTRYEAVG